MTDRDIRRFVWRTLRLPPRLWYALGLGLIMGRLVLLLTTTGRKTGRQHVTPLQYEETDGLIYVVSARGQKADWFQNILADPRVRVQVKSRGFEGVAEPVTNPERIADFLELRLRRHRKMIGVMLRSVGLPARPSRKQSERYAAGRALIIIRSTNGKKDLLADNSNCYS